MKAWVIILVIYFQGDSQRIDIQTTDMIFKNAIICNEFKLSKEFQSELRKRYKQKGIDYILPYCKPIKDMDKIIVNI